MVLRALDLFSGIGGITHGLRKIVTPVAFVEKNDEARAFLEKKNPTIPVFDDVCSFDATKWIDKVDIITAGWPCTGFSNAGTKTGFSHEASGLFTEVVRITKECRPKYLFLENSHTLSLPENVSVVVNAFDELDYDCRWITCRATCVGALHQRHRWFCLVVRRDVEIEIDIPYVKKFDWARNEPPRQIQKSTKENILHISLAGNAVVPDQVRYAMVMLCSFDTNEGLTLSSRAKNGFSKDGVIFMRDIKHPAREPLNIVLNPRENEASFVVLCDPEKVLTKPVVQKFWPTPLHSCKYATKCPRTLTKRVSKMLAACVGFSEGGDKRGYLSAEWVLWLMGYDYKYVTS
ncbi:cytosine-specific methyltransferase [Paramecium bursaria Chlorella virus AN69C]|uniref:Cytosine-specific methyltransferase n=1 Tax=Paramecium bursaria Chlorella virus IL3A TaxID=46019 RepID=M1HQ47_PBCVI|nr:cytosine-specific methyltransferase [Paramecium bursaria Chlorella virus AN69C]AGE53987.1 cytosine-specific methyltransferase [Paramecium bursaria Chlorella virus IL3A]